MWTEEQSQIISRPARSTVVIASPGSGKTTVLTEHIQHVVESKLVRPTAISAVTFTRQAAAHMKRKLQLSHSFSTKVLESLRIGTFHAQLFRALLGERSDIPVLLNPREQTLMMQQAIELVIGSRRQVRREEVRGYLTRYSWLVGHQQTSSDKLLQRVFAMYFHLKVRNHRWDYDDILLEVLRCLYHGRALKYLEELRYLLVDEFQDTNTLQWDILSHLHSIQKLPIFVVGDDDQAIYGFRGSSPRFLQMADQHFVGAKTFLLTHNFRSDKRVIFHSATLIQHSKSRITKPLQGVRDRVGQVYAIRIKDDSDEVNAVITILSSLHLTSDITSVGILARTRRQLYLCWSKVASLKEKTPQLASVDIQFRTFHDSKGKEWDCVILLDMVDSRIRPDLRGWGTREGIDCGEATDIHEQGVDDERRLAYVAMTRARHLLIACVPTQLNGINTAPSQFLNESEIPTRELSDVLP